MSLNKDILTKQQIDFLGLISKSPLTRSFYLSGGTALVAFYQPYRYSDDLDFFSEEEFDFSEILVFLKSNKEKLGYQALQFNQSFNRNLVFLEYSDKYTLKLEFTYYPFPQIDKQNKAGDLIIDSIEDIATNKLFTIYQNPRIRDFIDLYIILQNSTFDIEELIKKAKIKFDWHVDKLQLGKQFIKVRDRKDYPKLIDEVPEKDYEQLFLEYAKRFANEKLD